MARVAGVDGAPGGWAVVSLEAERRCITKVGHFSEIFDGGSSPEIVAVDVPVGLLDAFAAGGRRCDREARKVVGPKRTSSVFSAPVRLVLQASTYEEACKVSRASAANGGAISRQTWAIVCKIKEVDDHLQRRPAISVPSKPFTLQAFSASPATASRISIFGRYRTAECATTASRKNGDMAGQS
jgi:predicted RNase H-like nuclease